MNEQKIDLILEVQKFQLENTPIDDEVCKNQLIEQIERLQVDEELNAKEKQTIENREKINDALSDDASRGDSE